MRYVVVDLEWNQAMSSKSEVFDLLPIHLRGEIIQIGAVKLDEELLPGDEFKADIRPVYFRKMHHKVKKLTGFDKERLSQGLSFGEAFDQFMRWCGQDCVFLTWGYDDFGVMEQNLIIHDMDIDWMGRWINLQLIYNVQTGGDKNQKSLAAAMEHFGIDQTRTAHDALGDAYNTALVCSKLDMNAGIAQYDDATRIIAERAELKAMAAARAGEVGAGEKPLEHIIFDEASDRAAVWEQAKRVVCPDCGGELKMSRWLSRGDRRYLSLAKCGEHGSFLVRLHLRKRQSGMWTASRVIYKASAEMEATYKKRHKQAGARARRRGKSKPFV